MSVKVDVELPGGWTVFDQAPVAMALATTAGRVLRANAALERLVGRPPGALEGLELLELLPAERRAALDDRLHTLATAPTRSWRETVRVSHASGRGVWLQADVATIHPPEGGPPLLMAQVADVTSAEVARRRDLQRAERDVVTGLPSLRRLEEELDRFLAEARRHGRNGALVMISLEDLDAFAVRHGQAAADRVLRFVAATIHSRMRVEDTVARSGPDALAIVLRDTTQADARRVADELVALVGADGGVASQRVSAKAGVVGLRPELPDAVSALQAAEVALYAAGPGGVHEAPAADEPGLRAALVGSVGAHASGLLDGLRSVAAAPSVHATLRAVRDLLGMDISYVTRHTDSEQVFVELEGEGESFGIEVGGRVDLADTLCEQVVAGRLPQVMSDVAAHPGVPQSPAVREAHMGAFASVPVRLSDGTLYGTLCAASHDVHPELDARDLQFLHVLARMVAGELERDAALREQLWLRVQAAGAEALLSAVEARDRYTGAHSREVVELARDVGLQLGLDDETLHEVTQVALLHDIGKLSVPDAILGKPGPLDPDEMTVMKRHPADGGRIVEGIPELRHIGPAIRAEHERWDGLGYPDGLAGLQIPVASRIVLVCDAFHAMTTDRPYRDRMPPEAAVRELAAHAGTQFCPTCVEALFVVLARR